MRQVFLGMLTGLALALASPMAAAQGICKRTMGPYGSQHAAQAAIAEAQRMGFQTSGIWGQGGVVSEWSNRRYFFNVFYPC